MATALVIVATSRSKIVSRSVVTQFSVCFFILFLFFFFTNIASKNECVCEESLCSGRERHTGSKNVCTVRWNSDSKQQIKLRTNSCWLPPDGDVLGAAHHRRRWTGLRLWGSEAGASKRTIRRGSRKLASVEVFWEEKKESCCLCWDHNFTPSHYRTK